MRICEEAVVHAPVRCVWETLAAPAGVERWDPAAAGSKAIRSDDEAPERIVHRASDGRRRRERLVEGSEGERLVWEVADGLRFPLKALRTEWALERAGAATRVVACVDFRLHLPYGPVGGPFWLVQRRRRHRELVAALAGLKTHLGSSAASSPGERRSVARNR
jgi:hypothetical protein